MRKRRNGTGSVIYLGKKNTKAVANTSIVSAIINIVINLILIKFIGLYSAVISNLLAFFIMSIYRILDVNKKYFKIEINKKLIIKTILILLIVLPAYYINNLYINVISLLVSIIFAWTINKKSIKSIFNFLKIKIKQKKHEAI